jgi:sec-independent protein translocase protein TatC
MEGFEKKIAIYYPYLEDIRRRLFNLVICFILFFVLGFCYSGQILKIIVSFFKLEHATIITSSPFQFFDLAMSVGIYTSLVLCSPLFVWHVYRFLKDGLNQNEKKLFFILLPIGLMLFLAGFSYSFTILFFTLNSIASINVGLGMQNFWDINKFLLQIIWTSVFLGFIFLFPIVLTFLIRVGLITSKFLKEKRRHAIVVIFILTSLLPPTDGLSLIIMVLPLVALYELTIATNVVLRPGVRNGSLKIPSKIKRT